MREHQVGEIDHQRALRRRVRGARPQVAFADRILLNKVDLVTRAELQALKETISQINAFAELYETERSKVALDKLLNISAFSIERMNSTLDEFDIDVDQPMMATAQDVRARAAPHRTLRVEPSRPTRWRPPSARPHGPSGATRR